MLHLERRDDVHEPARTHAIGFLYHVAQPALNDDRSVTRLSQLRQREAELATRGRGREILRRLALDRRGQLIAGHERVIADRQPPALGGDRAAGKAPRVALARVDGDREPLAEV